MRARGEEAVRASRTSWRVDWSCGVHVDLDGAEVEGHWVDLRGPRWICEEGRRLGPDSRESSRTWRVVKRSWDHVGGPNHVRCRRQRRLRVAVGVWKANRAIGRGVEFAIFALLEACTIDVLDLSLSSTKNENGEEE
ncbi:hypothetical protein RJT34_07165 [Clitoria ternatea]|uniref:Uncharacterized protein n=1 Tax=Clitoria ternatea TaxID=43366 RepID=A0AAN9K511_CLITE